MSWFDTWDILSVLCVLGGILLLSMDTPQGTVLGLAVIIGSFLIISDNHRR